MIDIDTETEQAEQRKRIIRGRNVALGLILGGFALLFFFITLARISG